MAVPKQIKLGYKTEVLDPWRPRDLLHFAKHHIGQLGHVNVQPDFDGRTIMYSDIPYQRYLSIMLQISEQMQLLLNDTMNAPPETQLESLMICKWRTGDDLALHADNAYYEPGADHHEQPNYSAWRTHSCIFYLNEEYTGGELYFEDGLTIHAPENSMVMFPGGLEAVHGVKPITSGERWTVAGWFTDDPEHYCRPLVYPWEYDTNKLAFSHLSEQLG